VRPVIVSACLLGLKVRYDGTAKPRCDFLPKGVVPVPVCPEVFGGLPTPRPKTTVKDAAAVIGRREHVFNADGKDVTANFIRGAQAVLLVARLTGAKEAFLKARSPSCDVYRGVTAVLLRKHGIRLHSVD
jgi:uncharacterized protein YbbK (DUF523 family)